MRDFQANPGLLYGKRHQMQARQLLCVLSAAAAALVSISCGTPGHAILVISAPSTVVANAPFSATVTAMYQGHVDTVIDGPIHFTTTDKAALLPTLYVFTAADAGVHTFTGLTLVTPGNQTVTVSDYDATPVAGSTNILVTAAPADPADSVSTESQGVIVLKNLARP
jgi:hypothetical protein